MQPPITPPEVLAQPPTTQMVVSLKTSTWLSLSWTRRRPPFDAWHHSFHPDISYPEFCPADVPSSPDVSHPEFCPSTFSLIRISHIRNPVRPKFQLLLVSHSRHSVWLKFQLLRMSHIRRLSGVAVPPRLSWVQGLPMRPIPPGLNQVAKGLTIHPRLLKSTPSST